MEEISENIRRTRGRNEDNIPAVPQRLLAPGVPTGWLPIDGIEVVQVHDLGPMNVECTFCGALHWMMEKLTVRPAIPIQYVNYTDMNTELNHDPSNVWKYLLPTGGCGIGAIPPITTVSTRFTAPAGP